MHFVETHVFTAAVSRYLDEEHYRLLQQALALRPELGKVIPGSGGLRKVRWGVAGRGKRGGLRVIYYWASGPEVCYMLAVFGKNERSDLSQRQLRVLAQRVAEEFG